MGVLERGQRPPDISEDARRRADEQNDQAWRDKDKIEQAILALQAENLSDVAIQMCASSAQVHDEMSFDEYAAVDGAFESMLRALNADGATPPEVFLGFYTTLKPAPCLLDDFESRSSDLGSSTCRNPFPMWQEAAQTE